MSKKLYVNLSHEEKWDHDRYVEWLKHAVKSLRGSVYLKGDRAPGRLRQVSEGKIQQWYDAGRKFYALLCTFSEFRDFVLNGIPGKLIYAREPYGYYDGRHCRPYIAPGHYVKKSHHKKKEKTDKSVAKEERRRSKSPGRVLRSDKCNRIVKNLTKVKRRAITRQILHREQWDLLTELEDNAIIVNRWYFD